MTTIADIREGIETFETAYYELLPELRADKRTLIDTLASLIPRATATGMLGKLAVQRTLSADPGAMRTVISGLRSDADHCTTAADGLETVSQVALPAGLVGATGTAVGETILAMVTSLRQASVGQELVADHLSLHADVLDELETTRTTSSSTVSSAIDALAGIEVPDFGWMHGFFGLDTPFHDDFDEAYDIAVAAIGPLSDINRALYDYRLGLDTVEESEAGMDSALGDANGYARVGGVLAGGGVQPEGFTPLDLITSHYSSSPDQPDTAILSDTEWANFTERWNSLSDAEREELRTAMGGADDGRVPALVMSALATGAPLPSVIALANQLRELAKTDEGRKVLDQVAGLDLADAAARADPARPGTDNPVVVDGTLYDQDGNTCASTSLLLLGAQSDPFLALIIATGEPVDGYWPEMLENVSPEDLADLTPEERFRQLQVEVRNYINQDSPDHQWSLGDDPEDEPGSLRSGTETVTGTTRTEHSPESMAEMTALVDSGTPVSLSIRVLHPTDPQEDSLHQVVIVGHDNGEYQVYEPNTGVWQVSADELAGDVLPEEAVGRRFRNDGYYL